MFLMLRMFAAVTALGAVMAPVSAEPATARHERLANPVLIGIAHPTSLTATKLRGTLRDDRIASAVAPLDLRKLTLADFGDVDGAR